MTDIKIDDGQLKQIIVKAVYDAITPEKREELLLSATQNLLAEPAGKYDKHSPLEKAFHHAVADVARETVRELFKEDTALRAELQKLVTEAIARAFDDERKPQMLDHMAEAVATALRIPERY